MTRFSRRQYQYLVLDSDDLRALNLNFRALLAFSGTGRADAGLTISSTRLESLDNYALQQTIFVKIKLIHFIDFTIPACNSEDPSSRRYS